MQTWRPYITSHAISRFLERVLGVPPLGASEPGGAGKLDLMLERAGMIRRDAVEMMWPEAYPLAVDPGGVYALKRGTVRMIVRGGTMTTVVRGAWCYRGNSLEAANQIRGEEL